MFVLASTPLDAANQDATLARELTHHAEQDAHEAVAEWSAARGARRRELRRIARGCIAQYRDCQRRYRTALARLMMMQAEREMMRDGVKHLFARADIPALANVPAEALTVAPEAAPNGRVIARVHVGKVLV
jgi:hypothetical protein